MLVDGRGNVGCGVVRGGVGGSRREMVDGGMAVRVDGSGGIWGNGGVIGDKQKGRI